MPIYEGNTVEEAISKGLHALDLSKEEVAVNVIAEAKKGFLGFGKQLAKVSIEPTISEQPTETIKEKDATATAKTTIVSKNDQTQTIVEEEKTKQPAVDESKSKVLEDLPDEEATTALALYLTTISKELRAPAMVRLEHQENLLIFHLDTEKQGILIGKHGKVLNALQYLAQVFIHRVAANKLSVVVNVGNYREKRQAILQRLAKRTAEKVKQTGRPVFLEPMPAFERKQIHSALSKDEYIKTHSEGDEPYRYLVVEPAKKYF